jgi:hypothetical protein
MDDTAFEYVEVEHDYDKTVALWDIPEFKWRLNVERHGKNHEEILLLFLGSDWGGPVISGIGGMDVYDGEEVKDMLGAYQLVLKAVLKEREKRRCSV